MIQKRYYKISELAQSLSVATSRIRYHEEELNLLPYGTKGRERKYNITQADKIRMAVTLKDSVGMTLEGIKKAIKGGYAYSILKAYAS